MDDCVFAPEFMSSDYVRVTQLYCDGVVSIFLNSFFLGRCTTCQILVPPVTRIEHMTSALDVQFNPLDCQGSSLTFVLNMMSSKVFFN